MLIDSALFSTQCLFQRAGVLDDEPLDDSPVKGLMLASRQGRRCYCDAQLAVPRCRRASPCAALASSDPPAPSRRFRQPESARFSHTRKLLVDSRADDYIHVSSDDGGIGDETSESSSVSVPVFPVFARKGSPVPLSPPSPQVCRGAISYLSIPVNHLFIMIPVSYISNAL